MNDVDSNAVFISEKKIAFNPFNQINLINENPSNMKTSSTLKNMKT